MTSPQGFRTVSEMGSEEQEKEGEREETNHRL